MLIWKLFPVEKRLHRAPLHIVMGQYAHDHPHPVAVDRYEVLECVRDPSSYFLHLALRQSPPSCCFFSSWRPTSMHTSSLSQLPLREEAGKTKCQFRNALTRRTTRMSACSAQRTDHGDSWRCRSSFRVCWKSHSGSFLSGTTCSVHTQEVSLSVLLFTSSQITRRKKSVFAHMTFRKIPLHSS